jgi:hypothetical protein
MRRAGCNSAAPHLSSLDEGVPRDPGRPAHAGDDPRRSNQLMRWRIILQGAALLLFALLMTLLKS